MALDPVMGLMIERAGLLLLSLVLVKSSPKSNGTPLGLNQPTYTSVIFYH